VTRSEAENILERLRNSLQNVRREVSTALLEALRLGRGVSIADARYVAESLDNMARTASVFRAEVLSLTGSDLASRAWADVEPRS